MKNTRKRGTNMKNTRKRKRFQSCTKMRTVLIRHQTLNLQTGETTENGSEWVTRPCGIPLFGVHTETGVCSRCLTGWEHPENFFAERV